MMWILAASYTLMTGLLIATWRYRKFLARSAARIPPSYTPKAALFVPVPGLAAAEVDELEVLFAQDYPDYEILFGVLTRSDPAYDRLIALCERHRGRARVVPSGPSTTCSDKIQNLLACYEACHHETEILVLMDADLVPDSALLRRLVGPLIEPRVGAVTAHRWLSGDSRSFAGTLAGMANAAALVSMWLFSRVCGGVLAIRRDAFEWLDVPAKWGKAMSEDITICSLLVEKGLRIVQAESGLVLSRRRHRWSTYWSDIVSQLVLARVYAPLLWWQLFGFYLLTVPTGAYGLAKALARLTGSELSALDIGALSLSVVFMLQGWLVIDGAQRLFTRRGESVRAIPLALIPAYPLAMAIGALQLLVSAGRNSISVDGVRYRLDARDRTAVARDPFNATSGP
jgi:cellulose synthase/poly-beta-1,6-N-acetylglucosamine synthase-like glycosyltransferase